MAHLQYMPGDPRLVDQLVYELKSKGIFDQFRKDCISDVDTRPAYQNLRQRVESSVSLFLSRQIWKPDLNKNQLREKLRKHILDGNYLEQGVERIVDQVVNPKVASVFKPPVEDLVYNYLGITRKKSTPETSNDKGGSTTDLLPTDLEAVSPGSVKSNDDKDELLEEVKEDKMEVDMDDKPKDLNEISMPSETEPEKETETRLSGISDLTSRDSEVSLSKLHIPMPSDDINLENIPSPENSPPKIDLDSIQMPKEEPIKLKDIPLPDESPKEERGQFYKPANSEDDSSSGSSIIRNMSPLTPIRNFNNENSCDAQQAFENDTDNKSDDKKEPNTFRFTIEAKSSENSADDVKDKEPKTEKQEQTDLSYQFSEQININTFNTPLYEDSSNSHNLQIDYESDVNSKTNLDKIPFPDDPNSEDSKKESIDENKSHKTSHRSRDSQRHSSSSKDRRTDSKNSSSRDRKDSKHEKKSSKDDQSKSKSSSDKSRDRSDKKDSKDSKYKTSQKSSSSKDSKHRSSSSSQKHSSKHDDKKTSSSTNNKDKEKVKPSDKNSKEHKSSKDSKSRSDKDKKSKRDDKDKDKKDKKDTDDHYSASGRGNQTRRSTDRDSNDGSSSSKGSHNPSSSKSSESKTNKGSSSKSDNTSPSSESTSPSDKDRNEKNTKANLSQAKPIVRVDTRLERPIGTPSRLPFVPDVTLKKPKFAANLAEAKRLMKMRKFLDEEQKRMNQEAALLLEFQANVRPSLSQVYSSIPGPELEFACISNIVEPAKPIIETNYAEVQPIEQIEDAADSIEMELTEMNKETKEIVYTQVADEEIYEPIEYKVDFGDTETILNEISKKVYGLVDAKEDEEETYKSELKSKEEVTTEGIKNEHTEFEITVITDVIDENEASEKETDMPNDDLKYIIDSDDKPLEYFAEHEKFDAELERDKFEKFLKEYITTPITDKLYLINCDSYEESIIKEVSETFGYFEIVNYHKNGHKNKNIVKNVNVSNEIVLPLDRNTPIDDNYMKSTPVSPVFSPVKSECSFELSSDYDAKLEEMVNKTSRQEIMEIILGEAIPVGSPSKMPRIDYCMDDKIERNVDLKRKMSVESSENNNGHVLTPSKMRKLSESDQISSTTGESLNGNGNATSAVRSKYLGKARRVGLPRPRRTAHPNSPSSDKSVENYDTNDSGPTPPNGKLKTQRKVQRYDTSDLYKPKLHYLSRRNNIS